jgi:hypothetical protein
LVAAVVVVEVDEVEDPSQDSEDPTSAPIEQQGQY